MDPACRKCSGRAKGNRLHFYKAMISEGLEHTTLEEVAKFPDVPLDSQCCSRRATPRAVALVDIPAVARFFDDTIGSEVLHEQGAESCPCATSG